MEYRLARNPFHTAQYHLNMSTRYWLLKAEPDSRLVKGRDVKVTHVRFLLPPIFSFRSSSAFERIKTSSWEGVRNYEARNLMKEMQVGEKGRTLYMGDPSRALMHPRQCFIILTVEIQVSNRVDKGQRSLVNHSFPRNCCLRRGG